MVAIGILLLVAGVVLFFVEAHVPTHGVLGAGALAALVAGVVLLVLAADASLAVGLAIGFVAGRVLRIRERVRRGHEPHAGSVVMPPSPN